MIAIPADDGVSRARADVDESRRRREGDALMLADVDFITSALRDLRRQDRFAQRIRDNLREHG